MEKVSRTLHLFLRGGVYYYKRRVPTDVVSVFGKIIQQSLNTTNKKKAIERRESADVAWAARFAKARKSSAADEVVSANARVDAPPLTESLAVKRVQEYVAREDRRRRKQPERALTSAERAEARSELEFNVMAERGLASRYEPTISLPTLESIFERDDVTVDEKVFSENSLLDLTSRAHIELSRRSLARFNDDNSRASFDILFDPAQPSPVTVSELVVEFLTWKEQEGVNQGHDQKNLDKQRANAVLIEEILGADTLVRDVKWNVCRNAVALLAQVPSNRTKKYKGMQLKEAIARAAAEGQPLLSPLTQSQYLQTLKELLELAVNKELIAKNYARDLTPLRRDRVALEDKRIPFDLVQICQFFCCAYYRECGRHHVPYRHADKDWRFWLPLFQLLMGMRPREICQMHLSDLQRTPKGTWFVDITATNDDADEPQYKKTTKTATSRRKIPLHPELLKIGFVEFVAERREESNDPRVFRDITRNKYDDPAHYPLRRFRESFLKEAVSLLPHQTPYSFRHSFRDALRKIEASQDFLKAIGGWEGEKTISDNYGSKSNPDLYAGQMAKIVYYGLDLSHLYVKKPPAHPRQ
jgi:integrase